MISHKFLKDEVLFAYAIQENNESCEFHPQRNNNITTSIVVHMELTAQKEKATGEKGPATARTRDLRSKAECQPHKPRRLVESPRPPSPICICHRWLLSSNT